MDAFALHIGVHFVPAPLGTAFALFAAALCAWAATTLDHRRLGAALLALTIGLASAALLTRHPIPTTLDQLRTPPARSCSAACHVRIGPTRQCHT